MPKRIEVSLSAEQQDELAHVRHRHPKAHMRERAVAVVAVLKVAAGQTLTEVAETCLLIRHEPETIHLWIKQYLAQGPTGWQIRAGRARKTAFSRLTPEQACTEVEAVLQRLPRLVVLTRSRWWLDGLRRAVG